MKPKRRAFTLIELLVVMSIIMVLASMLLLGINAVRQAAKRAQTQQEISNLLMAIVQYETDFGIVPPSGVDTNNDGKLSNAVSGTMNHLEAWPASGWNSTDHPLVVCLIKDQLVDNGARTYPALYPKGKTKTVTDSAGDYVYLVDPYGNPYRYLEDGRRSDWHTGTPSRVSKRDVVMWSAGLDGLEDPLNNQIDDPPPDGRVDDIKELKDDICSWNH